MADRIAGPCRWGDPPPQNPELGPAATPAGAAVLAVAVTLLIAPISLGGQVPGPERRPIPEGSSEAQVDDAMEVGAAGEGEDPAGDPASPFVRVSRVFIGLDGKDPGASGTEITFVGPPVERWGIGTTAGLMVSSVGQFLGYMGLHRPIFLPWSLTLRPSTAVGVYARGGGRELGSGLEFRSGASLDLRMNQGMELSLFLYHVSNAGLGFRNPGLEAVGFGLALPLRRPPP